MEELGLNTPVLLCKYFPSQEVRARPQAASGIQPSLLHGLCPHRAALMSISVAVLPRLFLLPRHLSFLVLLLITLDVGDEIQRSMNSATETPHRPIYKHYILFLSCTRVWGGWGHPVWGTSMPQLTSLLLPFSSYLLPLPLFPSPPTPLPLFLLLFLLPCLLLLFLRYVV